MRRLDHDGSYALKRLKNPRRSARFEREVEAMKAMGETDVGIVPPVVDSGVDSKGRLYYVMPWYDDGSLEAAVDDGRFTDPADAIRILLRLADTLEILHSYDWAHRDLKPENVLMDGDSLVLCDLGLALPIGLEGEEERLTGPAEAVGSRYYIAPENESGFPKKFTSGLRISTPSARSAGVSLAGSARSPENSNCSNSTASPPCSTTAGSPPGTKCATNS